MTDPSNPYWEPCPTCNPQDPEAPRTTPGVSLSPEPCMYCDGCGFWEDDGTREECPFCDGTTFADCPDCLGGYRRKGRRNAPVWGKLVYCGACKRRMPACVVCNERRPDLPMCRKHCACVGGEPL